MNYWNKDLDHLPEQEKWKILLCGYYAEHKLKEKYDDKNPLSYIYARGFCKDRRRIPTVRKHLESLNLIAPSWNTAPTFDPRDEEVEKILAGFTKEPEFETSGYRKIQKYSYTKEEGVPVTDRGELYKDLDEFNAYELVYIYLNQTRYDFQIFKTTYNHRDKYYQTQTNDSHTLKIFPAEVIESTDEAVLLANNEIFAKEHSQEILTATFRINFKTLDNEKLYFTVEDLDARIKQVEEKQRLLRRTSVELSVLKRKALALGEESYKEAILTTSLDYARHRAPLWMNSDDDKKKALSMLFLKGTSLTTKKVVNR